MLRRIITPKLCVGLTGLYLGLALVIWTHESSQAPFPPEAKPQQGSRIVNELVGETIVILQSETALNGWTSKIEVYLEPQGTVPFSHIHQGYTETFEVLEGQLSVELDGAVSVVGAGQAFEVREGTSHVPANPFESPARFRVTVSGIKNFTTCLGQIHQRLGDKNASWLVRHLRVGRIASACDIYVSTIPWWFQSLGMALSAPILELAGFPVYEPMVNVFPKESNNE